VWIETVADEPGQGIFIYDGQIADSQGRNARQPAQAHIPDDFYAPDQHSEQMLM
jgi:hypothetical protein